MGLNKRKSSSENGPTSLSGCKSKKLKTAPSILKKKPTGANELEESATSEDAEFEGFDGASAAREADELTDGDSLNGEAVSLNKAASNGHSTSRTAQPNSTSSKEAHAKQRVLIQERKAAKPNADVILRSKKLWERLRRKSHVPLAERKVLVAELFELVTGRVKDFVLKHDAVRIVQTAIKYANLEQRKMMARELKGEFRQLAESRYAKFLIGKLLVHGDGEIRDLIVPEFYGHVRRMIKHPEASWILDDVYRGIATTQQKAVLLCEWYGAEFALFNKTAGVETTADLARVLEKSPEKRGPIMRSLLELINQLIQKKMTGFTMLHDAMLQYFLNIKQDGEEMTEFVELLKSDDDGHLLKNLAFTKSGARVVCLGLAHGSAKDRKHIIRSYKDTIATMAYDNNAHLVLLTAYEVIDDTVLTSKTIFPELLGKDEALQLENIVKAAADLSARTVILYLPAGRVKWLLADDMAVLDEIDSIRASTSKKDPAVRRLELLKAISTPMLRAIEEHVQVLLESSFGCQFITEVLLGGVGEKSVALDKVADAVSGDPSNDEHLARSSPVGKMLKSLVLGGRFNAKTGNVEVIEPPLGFHELLYSRIKPQLVSWATGPSSFVVVGLLEAEGFNHKDEALAGLRKSRKALEASAGKDTDDQREKTEMRVKREEGVGKGGKAADGSKKRQYGKADEAIGNKGAKLLLEKIK